LLIFCPSKPGIFDAFVNRDSGSGKMILPTPSEQTCDWVKDGCVHAKMGCVECKQPVIESVQAELLPMQERIAKYHLLLK
jgi:hypothetical protein